MKAKMSEFFSSSHNLFFLEEGLFPPHYISNRELASPGLSQWLFCRPFDSLVLNLSNYQPFCLVFPPFYRKSTHQKKQNSTNFFLCKLHFKLLNGKAILPYHSNFPHSNPPSLLKPPNRYIFLEGRQLISHYLKLWYVGRIS